MIGHFLNKLNRRAKIFSLVAIFILAAILFDSFLLGPLYKSMGEINENLALKKEMLAKYNSIIGMKGLYEKKLDKIKVSYNSLEKQFFIFSTADLAQAKIQEFVKNIARKNGVIVSRSSARKGELIQESPYLILIHTNIEISGIDKMKKVQSFLYDIEYESDKHISINDVKIRTAGFGASNGVYVTITLSAIAKLKVKT